MRIGTHPCMKGLISIDHRHRPIQLLVHDSDTSPDTGRASKSDTEAAPSSASTSAGGDRPAGGQILNNESHGTASSEGRDKVVENPSADKVCPKLHRPRCLLTFPPRQEGSASQIA